MDRQLVAQSSIRSHCLVHDVRHFDARRSSTQKDWRQNIGILLLKEGKEILNISESNSKASKFTPRSWITLENVELVDEQ
jgi:hypothetical protein